MKNSNAILAYDVLDHHDLFRFELLQLSAIFIKADPEIIAEDKERYNKILLEFHKARRYPYQTIRVPGYIIFHIQV